MHFDAFLSYNSADHTAVTEIAEELRDQEMHCFLDRWYLPIGRPWRMILEENLTNCRSIVVFIGPHGLGQWQQREIDMALDRQAGNLSLPVIPYLLPGAEPPLGFLKLNTWIDRRSLPKETALILLRNAIRREHPEPEFQLEMDQARDTVCPYRGLLYFREEDAPLFFGRESATDKLSKLVHQHRIVSLVGSSGSGKSSVVRSGLVPLLRKDRHTVWDFCALVPGAEPLKSLAFAIITLIEPDLNPIDRRARANNLASSFLKKEISST